MDKFINRLKYYGIGFGFGLVFVFFFFQNRGCAWLPSNRVKNSILDRVLTLSEEDEKTLKNNGIRTTDIISLLNEGTVNFDKSKKEGPYKVYHLSNNTLKFYFILPKEAFTCEVKFAKMPLKDVKPSEIGFGKLIHFPMDDDLIFVDTNDILTCQMSELNFINQRLILTSLKKNGKIDYKNSNLYANPKPIVSLIFKAKNDSLINAKAIWYKNKINIIKLNIPFQTKCN
jgi:hypothetical protein